MKVCYLIQTHKNPEQIYRLVKTIKKSSPRSFIVVSHDITSCSLDETPLKAFSDVKVILSKGGRAEFSLVQGYLNAVDWLLSRNIDFDWLVNLTGQDYPIQPLPQIEDFLAKTKYDVFLEYFEVFSNQSHWSMRESRTRYLYKYKQFANRLTEWQRKLLNPLKTINYLQPFFRVNFAHNMTLGVKASTPFNENFICYGGSFFCTLSKKCIQYLHNFCDLNPNVVDYYRSVYVPEESFIQTVLINSQLFSLCNDCKRYFDFSGSRHGHPIILTANNFSLLLESHTHFARKFDISQDSRILDLLDTKVLQSSPDSSLTEETL